MAKAFNFFSALKSHIFRKQSGYFFKHFVFYSLFYKNYHHDHNPHVFILWSMPRYTHALNFNYLSPSDIMILSNMLATFKIYYDKGGSFYDFYHFFLKRAGIYYNIVRKCYRVYFSTLSHGFVIGNGIHKKSNFKVLYKSYNPYLVMAQKKLNDRFNLDDVKESKKKKEEKTLEQSAIEKQKKILGNLKSWKEGLSINDETSITGKNNEVDDGDNNW